MLFEIAYLIVLSSSTLVEQKRSHGLKFPEKYQNQVACQYCISATGDYFFSEFLKLKLEHTNFIGILNDGTTDAAAIEQEVLYVTFLDLDTYEPCLAF